MRKSRKWGLKRETVSAVYCFLVVSYGKNRKQCAEKSEWSPLTTIRWAMLKWNTTRTAYKARRARDAENSLLKKLDYEEKHETLLSSEGAEKSYQAAADVLYTGEKKHWGTNRNPGIEDGHEDGKKRACAEGIGSTIRDMALYLANVSLHL